MEEWTHQLPPEIVVSAPTGRTMPQWINSQLHILDIGYVATDHVQVRSPLPRLGILHRSDMRCVAEWIHRHLRRGTTIWHEQSGVRTVRYLTQHNLLDQSLRDVERRKTDPSDIHL